MPRAQGTRTGSWPTRSVGLLGVVVLDVILDQTRSEDAVFFVVLAVVMVGIAALARWMTRRVGRRRRAVGTSPTG